MRPSRRRGSGISNVIIVGTVNFASLGGLGIGIMSAIGRREQERRYLVARENRRPMISAERNRLPVVAALNIVNRCRMLAVFMEAIEFDGGSGKISAGRRLLLVATLLRHSAIGF